MKGGFPGPIYPLQGQRFPLIKLLKELSLIHGITILRKSQLNLYLQLSHYILTRMFKILVFVKYIYIYIYNIYTYIYNSYFSYFCDISLWGKIQF